MSIDSDVPYTLPDKCVSCKYPQAYGALKLAKKTCGLGWGPPRHGRPRIHCLHPKRRQYCTQRMEDWMYV